MSFLFVLGKRCLTIEILYAHLSQNITRNSLPIEPKFCFGWDMRSTRLNQATGKHQFKFIDNKMMTEDEEAMDTELQYLRLPLIPQVYPWLLISHGKQLQRHTFFSITENYYHTRIVPCLRYKTVLCCCFGWLILRHWGTNDCYLFNPVSMENIQLPPLESFKYVRSALLSKPPSDPNCHILFIGIPNRIAFCQPGDEKFVEQSSVFGEDSLDTATAINGKIYGLTFNSCTFVTLDFVGPTIQFSRMIKDGLPCQIQTASPPENSQFVRYLIESCGELLYVHKIYSGSHNRKVAYFKVFRLNTSEIECEEVKSLGERVIFLNHYYGMSCSIQESGVRGNSIYFAEPCDRNLYVYNMENRSQLLKLPCPIARRHARLSWIMPLFPPSS